MDTYYSPNGSLRSRAVLAGRLNSDGKRKRHEIMDPALTETRP
jgi:hypothetical protein